MALLLLYMCPHRVDGAAEYAEAFTTAMYGFTTAVYVSSYYMCVLVHVIEETEKEYAMLIITALLRPLRLY